MLTGKVALANTTVAVSGPTSSNVIDYVGYGTANSLQGSGAGVRRAATLTSGAVDVSGLPVGIYLLDVQTTTGQILRQRFMKE